MPKRTDIKKILIIGSGPIVIGQACEFDYSGTQACKALREDGYEVVLVNSNPATIMTDPTLANRTYIEPITPEMVEKIIERERPDALLPTMGGQTALNVSVKLAESGVLEKYGVELIGARLPAIKKAEDRDLFKQAMQRIGLEVPRSGVARTFQEADGIIETMNFPAIIRPSFTMGGMGGGIAYNREEYEHMVRFGLECSPVSEILIEEYVIGWKEFELAVMRDCNDNVVIVCSIENLDPMGVHTGDSITVAPAQTLTDKEYHVFKDPPLKIIKEIRKKTRACFEPTIDYVVVKIPRFAFEKFQKADPTLTTQMKSVGEAMAIGRTFKEAFQKALRSLEIGCSGFDRVVRKNRPEPRFKATEAEMDAIRAMLKTPRSERLFFIS